MEPAGQEGSPSADGGARDGWVDYQSGEELVSDLNEILSGLFPRANYPDAEPFDPRFLRGGASRLDEIVQAVNKHQFDLDDLITGMFDADTQFPEFGRADHDAKRVTRPAQLIGKVMSGPLSDFVAYGLRGRHLVEARTRYRAERDDVPADRDDAERMTDHPSASPSHRPSADEILATITGFVPPRVRPLAGCRVYAKREDWETDILGPVWHHPGLGVAFAGKHDDASYPGHGWEKAFIDRGDWRAIKDQGVIPLRQDQAA